MMKKFSKQLAILTMVLTIALGPIAAMHLVCGQAVKGTLLGTVTDTNNAVVAGATVTITEVNTNITRSAATNENGNYVFDNLALGKYSVQVERAGFKKVLKSGVDVSGNNTTRADIEVEAGTDSEHGALTATEGTLHS